MTKYKLYTALSQLYELQGVELDEDTFETYALSAYNKIGNHDYKLYRIHLTPEPDPAGGWYVCKPCNMDSIEAITLDYESAVETSATNIYAGLANHSVEQWIEADKHDNAHLYLSGKFVKYREVGDRIYFTEPYRSVNILYKGNYVDEDGLPYINDKELDAIVAYCLYAVDMRNGRLTKDPVTIQMAQLEYQQWQRACSEARVPMELSQNTMNEVLDAMSTWEVHNYGSSSTKPIR